MRDTLIRVRDLRSDPGPSPEEEVLPAWLIAAGSGSGAALASATMLVVLAVLGWLTGAGGTESAGATVSAGLAGWAFAHGAPLALPEGQVGLIPWLLTAWPLLCAWWSAQRIVPDPEHASPRLRGFGGVRRDVAVAGAAYVAGYVLTGLVLVVGAHLGGARPSPPLTVLGAGLLATVAYALALRPAYRERRSELAPRLTWAWREYVPVWASRAVRPALTAVAATLGLGLLLVVVAVGVGIEPVSEVYARVGGGAVGATLLTVAQLAYLPTVAVWAAAWLAGPGFVLGGGTSVTWAASEPGIIPLVPVLAAVPPPGPLPAWTPVVVVFPLLVGLGLGIATARRAEPTWAGRTRTTGVAVVLYGVAILLLSVAASGPVGAGRFAHVGVDAVVTSLALTAEVGLSAFLVVLLTGVRLRRLDRVASVPRATGTEDDDGADDIEGATPSGRRGLSLRGPRGSHRAKDVPGRRGRRDEDD